MAVVIKGFDFGEDGEFLINANLQIKNVLNDHLVKVVNKIIELAAPDGSGVEEVIEELKKLQNGQEVLRAVIQGISLLDLEYEVKYVNLETLGNNETGFLTISGQNLAAGRTVRGPRPIIASDLILIKANLAIYSLQDNFLDIPMVDLIRSNYNFDKFDSELVRITKQNFTSATEVDVFNLQVLSDYERQGSIEYASILNQFGADLDNPQTTFPVQSIRDNLTTEQLDQILQESFRDSKFKFTTDKFVTGWIRWFFGIFSRDPEELSVSAKVRAAYLDFISKVIQDDEDVLFNPNTSSLKEKFDQTISEKVNAPMVLDGDKINLNESGFYSLLAREFENERRLEIFNQQIVTPEEIEAAGATDLQDYLEKKALADLAGAEFGVVTQPELTEEDIKNRQKFFKQCALMMNMPILAESFTKIIQARVDQRSQPNQARNAPFDGRLFMVSNPDDQSETLSKMLNSEVAKELFEIPPAVLSSLVPKIKLYRVSDTEDGVKKTEFVFETSEDLNRERNFTAPSVNFLDQPFDKGSGVGVKNFSFEFNGTNPAESRKDIKANLVLHFQSFGDFVAERKSYDGEVYRFVDLILHPPKDEKEIIHRDQYSPSYYRIMAEVGYHIPSDSELSKMFPWYQGNAKALVEALQRTNKVFYLCMIDHDFKINVDGTVDLTISYGAYVETILKTHQYDALATPEIVAQRNANLQEFVNVVNSGDCTQDQLQRILSGLDAQETVIRERALRSIITRLIERNKIFVCEISQTQASSYRTLGFFRDKPELRGLVSQRKEIKQQDALQAGQERGVTQTILSQVYLPEDYNFNNPHDNTIQYFYFGDLLHTILDTMYDPQNPSVLREDVENCRFILGSFDFDIYKDGSPNQNYTVNLAQIPISVEYFADWFQNNVLKKGDTRKSFPIITFIRNLSNNLLQQSLLESCVNRRIDKNFSFQTGQITAYNETSDPMLSIFEQNRIPVVQVDNYRNNVAGGAANVFPFRGDTTSATKDIKNYYNYMYLGAFGSSLSVKGTGNYKTDNENGMYHIEIGNNKGIVKSVNFAKTDMQFVREARFFQQGIDGLLQLSTVYKVTIEMFGNTIFYPGMGLFLNPYGIGGPRLGSPTQGGVNGGERSLANKLGIGGYHTVTSVRSSIGIDGFKTTVEAQMYYAGDGSQNYAKKGAPTGETIKKITDSTDSVASSNKQVCEAKVAAVESDLSLIEKEQPTKYFASI